MPSIVLGGEWITSVNKTDKILSSHNLTLPRYSSFIYVNILLPIIGSIWTLCRLY